MKRSIFAASCVLAVALPGSAQALSHSEAVEYGKAYVHVEKSLGIQAAGCKLIGPHSTCNGRMTDARIRSSTGVLQRMFAPAPRHYSSPPPTSSAPASTQTTYGGGGYGDVPGVPSGFASCVAMRESTNGAGSSNIYGIEGSGGQGSLAEQKQAFAQMYGARGSEPWSPYDGC